MPKEELTIEMLCDMAMLLPNPLQTVRDHWTVEYGGKKYEFRKIGYESDTYWVEWEYNMENWTAYVSWGVVPANEGRICVHRRMKPSYLKPVEIADRYKQEGLNGTGIPAEPYRNKQGEQYEHYLQ